VSFPIAFSHATIRGFESKLELRGAGPFSGFISYSNMLGLGQLPVAGGLFLGDNADQLNGKGSFPISHDQRNTVRTSLHFQPRPRFWLAIAGSYNSGLPFEIDCPANPAFIAQQYGSEILSRINFDRGRIRPSSSVDASAGIEVMPTDKAQLRFQTNALNLANRLNVINFAGVFSGTGVDAPRTYAVRLRAEF
jgi:hypothetical protein